MRPLGFALVLCAALVGCNKGDANYDPNYKAEVKMSEADKAKADENAVGRPRDLQGGQVKLPPGKGGGAPPQAGGGTPAQAPPTTP